MNLTGCVCAPAVFAPGFVPGGRFNSWDSIIMCGGCPASAPLLSLRPKLTDKEGRNQRRDVTVGSECVTHTGLNWRPRINLQHMTRHRRWMYWFRQCKGGERGLNRLEHKRRHTRNQTTLIMLECCKHVRFRPFVCFFQLRERWVSETTTVLQNRKPPVSSSQSVLWRRRGPSEARTQKTKKQRIKNSLFGDGRCHWRPHYS